MSDIAKRKKFKTNEMCLIIDAIVHDEDAMDHIYKDQHTLWANMYLKDEDDKSVGIVLLFERLYMANQLAMIYNESLGFVEDLTNVHMMKIQELLDSTEWRQLEKLELLKLLNDLRASICSENKVICFANEEDLRLLDFITMFYLDKYLKYYIAKC